MINRCRRCCAIYTFIKKDPDRGIRKLNQLLRLWRQHAALLLVNGIHCSRGTAGYGHARLPVLYALTSVLRIDQFQAKSAFTLFGIFVPAVLVKDLIDQLIVTIDQA
ncbi:hypothetical protein D9M68_652570 [compost metagenome]